MYERADIVDWRARYLRKIRQYQTENKPILYIWTKPGLKELCRADFESGI